MLNENTLLEYIKNSHFIEVILKKNLIRYFNSLSHRQIQFLLAYFRKQKKEILRTMASFKDKDDFSFEEMKTQIDQASKRILQKQEQREENTDSDDVLQLLYTIY
ncbi:hypothetical protein CSB09_02250 [Candidatus Gracilibacteria bacterium]|nr:MAG: hypothetical protein CSB09_02250 [Candidatus Gracilibacteria bacterium]